MQKKSTVNDLPAVVSGRPAFRRGISKKTGMLYTIMKVTLIQMTVAMIFSGVSIAFDNHAQEILKRKVSLELKDISLMQALGAIEKEANVKFVYSPARIDLDDKVSLDVSRQKLGALLSELLTPRSIKFRVQEGDDYIVLVEYEKAESSPPRLEDPVNKEIPQATVSGTVTDEQGNSIPGVNIIQKGTTNGTTTDGEGKYSLMVAEDDAVLVFSFIGYTTQEIAIGGRTVIDIILSESVQSLDEVVVVGYGTQQKVNLTGSITMVDAKEMAEVSMPTVSQAMMGRSPGVFIKNGSGQPGENGIELNIRGFGSPLIIVDGMPVTEAYFQQINPNDIEQFNILKDASAAAVYGARAGNGVILVTTKRGTVSAPKFSFNSNFALQHFTIVPDFVNSAQYASMQNVSLQTEERPPAWTEEEIQKFRDGTDPDYVDVDWWDEALRPTAPQWQQNLSVRGGTETVKYFASVGYFNQKGMLKSDDIDHQRFSLRSNLDIALTKKLNVGIDLTITNQSYLGPSHKLERTRSRGGIMGRIYRSRPFYPNTVHPDPSYISAMGSGSTINPYAMGFIDNVGFDRWNKVFGFSKLRFGYELPLGFAVKAIYDINRTYDRQTVRVLEMPTYDYDAQTGEYIFRRALNGFNSLEESNSILKNLNQQYFLTWDREFGDHSFSALFVHEILSNHFDEYSAFRRDYEFDLDYLFAGPDLNKDNDGFATEGGRKAYIGRINYNYRGKYMLEVSSRWDGSPNFPPETRWGLFPSASAGWRISEEDFFKDNVPFVSNLKLRVSHGRLGFDRAGAFQYLSTYRIRSRYIYEEELSPGIRTDALPNPTITWEKMTTSNAGFDFSLFGDKIEGTFDYFYRKRTDVLGTRTGAVPDVVGANLPEQNFEEYDNRGWEAMLAYRNNVGSIHYSLGGNVSMNREKTLFRDQDDFATMEAFRTGNEIGEWTDRFWTLPTDGLFRSKEEIENWADIDGKNNATIQPGDIKFIDTNGDGRITNEDRIIAGRGTMPRLMYGINVSASWKGFDIMMLWQGASLYNVDLRRSPDYTIVFYAENTPNTFLYENSYVPEMPENQWMPANTNAIWPRFGTDSYNRSHPNRDRSQFWLSNGAYVRLKNVQIGYTIPEKITTRWGIEHCKIFVAGYNVLTFSQYDFIDPEADTSPARVFGDYHPPLGTYNLGLQLNF